MKFSFSKLLVSILISLGTGVLSGLLSRGGMEVYQRVNKPAFSPPPILFPIVWTILFILMGISAYMIYISNAEKSDKASALTVYGIQLAVNFLWPIFFFNCEAFLFSFIWIIILWILIIAMIALFNGISKTAAYLQIPYLIWVTFAAVLNFSIYWLNK